MEIDADVLEHHGVKGMHWGIRRAEKKWQKNIYSVKGAVAVHNAVADQMNGPHGLGAQLNNSPRYKGKNLNENPVLRDRYWRDFNKVAAFAYVKAVKQVHGVSPSGTREAEILFNADHTPAKIVIKQHVSHALGVTPDIPTLQFELNFDDEGKIISLTKIQDSVTQSTMSGEEFMEHHGIKGMHWGVRHKKPRPAAFGKDGQPLHKRLKDEDLKKYVARLELEKRAKDLSTPHKSETSKFVNDLLKSAGKTVALTSIGFGLNQAFKKAFKT